MKRVLCLASGRGSNFRAFVDAAASGQIPGAEPVGLLTDRPDTPAEAFARERQLPSRMVDYRTFADRSLYQAAFQSAVCDFNPDLILALGYMRIIDAELIRLFPARIINVHPSLLPAFPGMHSQKQAFEYGVRITGATVHFVDEGTDTGPIILQSAVDVPADATLETLSALILKEEHRILIEAVRLFCADLLLVEGRKVNIRS